GCRPCLTRNGARRHGVIAAKIDRKTHERKLPWYQILVHNRSIETYVAESHLEEDVTKEPINHPYVPVFFNEFEDGTYKVGGMVN
ncbi:MAG: heat shock protein HspQ, partial [Myxococcota bacterium]